jgi:hypothetical protein
LNEDAILYKPLMPFLSWFLQILGHTETLMRLWLIYIIVLDEWKLSTSIKGGCLVEGNEACIFESG